MIGDLVAGLVTDVVGAGIFEKLRRSRRRKRTEQVSVAEPKNFPGSQGGHAPYYRSVYRRFAIGSVALARVDLVERRWVADSSVPADLVALRVDGKAADWDKVRRQAIPRGYFALSTLPGGPEEINTATVGLCPDKAVLGCVEDIYLVQPIYVDPKGERLR
ncbi:hypothetical protein [Salininema proteolyticum]|uniref:Uncharacterized protein n=1 Tax=Salininema proteolyticum TaxID=1607685 RepID=A0ABV8U1H9_9ACTN